MRDTDSAKRLPVSLPAKSEGATPTARPMVTPDTMPVLCRELSLTDTIPAELACHFQPTKRFVKLRHHEERRELYLPAIDVATSLRGITEW